MNTSTTDRTVSRRTALAGLGAGSLGLALAATTRQAAAQDASPVPIAVHPLVGTWIVDRDIDGSTDAPTMLVHTADGSTIDSLFDVCGAWQPTGPRSAHVTLVGLIDGGAGGSIVIRASVEIDDAGTTLAGSDTLTIVGTDGTVLNTIQGHSRATRLVVQGPEAAGTPLPGVPTWTPAPPADATPTA
jgi:hypothetical protein